MRSKLFIWLVISVFAAQVPAAASEVCRGARGDTAADPCCCAATGTDSGLNLTASGNPCCCIGDVAPLPQHLASPMVDATSVDWQVHRDDVRTVRASDDHRAGDSSWLPPPLPDLATLASLRAVVLLI